MTTKLTELYFRQFVFRGKVYTREIIEEAVNTLAGYLQKNIHSSSPFVAFTAYNHIKTAIALYAIFKAGKIAVVIDPGCRSFELSEIMKDTDPAAVFFLDNETIRFDYESEIVFRATNPGQIIRSEITDVRMVAYTNAEDGYSKGAMLTEQNIMAEIRALIETEKIFPGSLVCALLPFYHLYGLMQGILAPTHAGGTSLILEVNLLQLEKTLETIRQAHTTHLFTLPSVYYLFSKVPAISSYFPDIQDFYSGGIKLSPMIFESFLRKTNRKIREGYGLTECSPAVALNYQPGDPDIQTIGLAFPGCEIKILDDVNQELVPGETGEICIRGDMVFKGYFNQEQATQQVLREGWLHTGDLGKMDRNGFVYFVGLKKPMFNSAGTNVYPTKLTRLMSLHENVWEVSITSGESILQGQTIHAKITLRDDTEKAREEYKKWCYENINNAILPKNWSFE